MGYRKLRRERPNKKKRIQILCYRKNRGKCKASIFARCSADEGEEGYFNPDNWTVEKTSKHDHVKISHNLEEINLNTGLKTATTTCCNQPLAKIENLLFRDLLKVNWK